LRRYKQELERRERAGRWQARRVVEGLETYDVRCNASYLDSFALDSDSIVKYRGPLSPRRRALLDGRRSLSMGIGHLWAMDLEDYFDAVVRFARSIGEAMGLVGPSKEKREKEQAAVEEAVMVSTVPI
jgi:hypothetical protein